MITIGHAGRGRSWLATLAMAALFAACIIAVPWETIRGAPFADVVNYVAKMAQIEDYGPNYFSWTDSFVGWISYEYFWFRLMVFAVDLGMAPETFIALIAVISSVLTYRFMAARVGPWVPFIVLINPISIDLFASQSRSALAFALFLTIVDLLPAPRHIAFRFACLAALPFIHTAGLVFISLYAGCIALASTSRISPLAKNTIVVAAAVCFAVAIAVALPDLIEATGDRRNLEAYEAKTLAYLAFWFLLAGALFISYDRDVCARWEYAFALFICLAAAVIDYLGTPGFRFIALAIPVIWVAVDMIREPTRTVLRAASAAYLLLLFYYWIWLD